MRRWSRAYHSNGDGFYALRYLFAAFMSVCGLGPLLGFVVDDLDPSAAFGIVPFVVLWQLVLWRVVLVGVYVSDYGVKVRTLSRTHVIPWSRVVRAWAGQARDYDAWQIWLSVCDPEQPKERDIDTPI